MAEKKSVQKDPGVNTGVFIGEYDKDQHFLKYVGTVVVIKFSAKLQKPCKLRSCN